MIFVPRVRQDENGVPIQPSAAWFLTASNRRASAELEAGAHEVDRGVYAADEVQRALEKLFHDKCSYCEGKPTANSDWDVEHFRPKGRVAERDGHPGYYWLAYAWENLYLGCQHCNQKRRDRPRWGDTSLATAPAQGKLDQFPLADEATRAQTPQDDASLETALLLDPCRDLPEMHIRFDPHGDAFSVGQSLQGEVSIRIFHLRRKRLKTRRKERIERVVARLREIQKLRDFVADLPVEFAELGAQRIEQALENLFADYLADSCDFAAVGRWVVRDPVAFGL